eukprot:c7739_g1_i1.p1 GENE.c7739_g1_i1~~c7739_g1_i1.p1  ORF type:complete len:395 (-),score=72.43 c7739_g1_i1:16-1170(-)
MLVLWLCTLTSTTPSSFAVVGFLPEYRFYINIPDAMDRLTDLILFSAQPKSDGTIDAPILQSHVVPLIHQTNKDRVASGKAPVRVHLSIGGAGRSDTFVMATSSRATRTRFAKSILSLVTTYSLDGIDLDWEGPTNPQQMLQYMQLMEAIHNAIAEKSKTESTKKIYLSVDLHPGQYLEKIAYDWVDRVHLMTYDNFRDVSGHSSFEYAVSAAERLLKSGLRASQLFLGIPAYGRSISDPNTVLTYSEIIDKYRPPPHVSQVQGDIAFNSIGDVQSKTKYAKKHDFGGVMVWEIGQDSNHPEHSLVAAIASAAKENVVFENPTQVPKKQVMMSNGKLSDEGEDGVIIAVVAIVVVVTMAFIRMKVWTIRPKKEPKKPLKRSKHD